ncbi:MAG: DUF3344 domain-containing protein [Thermoanaerobaculia bacterium]|nr:DUF3344 domain-containing protein [Thermoanaerobaculia bacterium]
MKNFAASPGGPLRFSTLAMAFLLLAVPPAPVKADGNEALNESYRVTQRGGVAAAGVGLRGDPARPAKADRSPRPGGKSSARPLSRQAPQPSPTDLGFGTITITGIPAGATVTRAFLYWAILGSNDTNPVTFDGEPITGTLIGTSTGSCWEAQGTFAYRADVTSLVAGNGDYFLEDFPNWQISDADTHGASLVVVYSDPASPMRTIIINDGSAALIQWETESATTSFTSILPLSGGAARCVYLVGDGDSWCEPDDQVTFNDSLVADSPFIGADGYLWDTTSVDVTAAYLAPTSTTTVTATECDCLQWVAAILVSDGAAPPPPPPTGTVSGGGTICAGTSATLQADLTGTAPWTLTWSDGFVQIAGTSPAVRTVSPTFSQTYTLAGLSDANGPAGASDLTGQAQVVVKPVPSSTMELGGAVCSLATGLTACVPDAGPGATYLWEVTGGTLTSAASSRCVTITVSAAGALTLKATVTKDGCASVTAKSFEIGQAPLAPKPLLPQNGATEYDRGFVSWIRVDDQAFPLGTHFDLYFDTVNPPEKLLFTDIPDNHDAYVPVWFANLTYYWNVVARTPCGTASFSAPASYTSGACPWTGAAPTLVSPSDGAADLGPWLTLTWEPVAGASHYDVAIGTSADSVRLYRVLSAPKTSLDISLAPGKTYFWKVTASPACGTFTQVPSAVRSFTTAAGAFSVTSLSPGFVNRWTGGTLELSGSGFLASSQLFADLDGSPAGEITPGIFTNSFSTPTLLTGELAPNPAAEVGLYDTGVSTGGVESARLLQSLAVRAFTDVTEADYYFLSSARVADEGLMPADVSVETAGPQFGPARSITRGEMSQYLARAYRWWRTRTTALPPATCNGPAFFDIPCGHPRWLEIYWLKTWSITVGRQCGTETCYFPDELVTRAELVTFLQRMRQTEVLSGPRSDLLSTVGETDPGCSQPYPACKGWTDLDFPAWPRREVNVAFHDRMTKGCAGSPGEGLSFCPFTAVTRAEIAEFLSRILGLVPTP